MRVAYVLPTTSGGIGRHVRSLVEGLRRRAVEVLVLAPSETEERFRFADLGVQVHHIDLSDRPRPIRDARTVARLRRLLREEPLVHAHGLRAGGLTALALTGRRTPLVVTVQNALLAVGAVGVVYRGLERLVVRRANVVLAVSPDLADRARELGAHWVERAVVAAPKLPPSTRSPEKLREDLDAGSSKMVVTVGRLAPQKGLEVLLDAAGLLSASPASPIVFIAGEGPLRPTLEARIRAEDLPVRLLGHREDVADLMAAADVLALPSLWEGQPLALQEMLRAGRPIVATHAGGTPEVAGDAAALVPPGDAPALARAVGEVLRDDELAKRLSSAAKARAAELPTEDDAVEAALGVYRRLTPG